MELDVQGTTTRYYLFPDFNPRDDFQLSVLIHSCKDFQIRGVQAGLAFLWFSFKHMFLVPIQWKRGVALTPWGPLFDWASWIPLNGVQTACVIKAAWEGWRAKLVSVGGHVFSSHRQRTAMCKIWQELVPKKNKTAPFSCFEKYGKNITDPHVEEIELLENLCDLFFKS